MNFVAIGEAMIELAPLEKADEYKLAFAGDTFNTAWYLKRVNPDVNVSYSTRIGSDETSAKFLSFVDAHGLDAEYISRSATREMGLYIISLKNGERSFSYWRSHSAAREMMDDKPLLERALSENEIIYFSGITLAILDDKARTDLLAMLASARANGKYIAFDSNLRPRLWQSDAQMCEWISKAASVSDLVLPSYDDEAVYFADQNPEATLSRYLDLGVKTVVIKNGEGPILCSHLGTTGNFVPIKVENLVDTTAAGDSFNAGFFAHFAPDDRIETCLEEGSSLAAKVISRRGALVEV